MRVLSIDPGLRHMSLCLMYDGHVEALELIDLLDGKTTKKMPTMETLIDRIICHLDSHDLRPDQVLVEKQPHTNAKMRVVEAVLLTYFKCKGVPVRTYSAKYKLQGQGDSITYSARKKLSVKLVTEILNTGLVSTSGTVQEVFLASSKRDDLCDALLMCMHYLKTPVPCFQ